jgi:hypothetical protein
VDTRAGGPYGSHSWWAVVVLVGYLLLAPPVLVLAPLAALLLAGRPVTIREWLWLIGAGLVSAMWFQQDGGLASQFIRAGAVLLTGTFLALTLWRPSAHFSRALLTVGLAGLALALWMWHLGVGWFDLQRAVEHDLWAANREFVVLLGGVDPSPATRMLLDHMASTVRTVSSFYPALLTLAGLAGLRLAWSWFHRITRHPLGVPSPPFRAFEFSDQLVWGWVAGLALYLAPLPRIWTSIGANILMVWAVLYALRGLAVFAARSKRVPAPVLATLAVVALVLLPFVVGGLTLLGLADTWLDFRRRLAPAT